MVGEIERTPRLKYYVDQVEAYEREAKSWESRSKKIVKRYRDSRGDNERKISRFNILWSNVQTLHPALYDGAPTPNVDRRFEDDEEVNTTVAQILERSVSYFVKSNDFDDCMNQVVLDRLLPGRGTAWVRYVPNFKDVAVEGGAEVQAEGSQVTDDVVIGDAAEQELYSEDVVLDYVHWQDYGHNVCRTWQENRMVWRRVYLDKRECLDRFGERCNVNGAFAVPLDAKPLGKKDDDQSASGSKASIYELWDRVTKKAYWFHKDMEDFLDERDDPLRVSGFYPCPKPVYATLGNDSMIPTPDFLLYQDQAQELDVLTARIEALNKALKVVGVYDASAEGVQRMLSENVDNKLIPVEQWALFAEKGGLKGVVDFFPIEMVADVLLRLYEAREKTKQDIYEITGISDIVRGATNPNETLGAQELKGKYAGLRLNSQQKEVARFSRDAVRIMTEIIAEHFSIETIKNISGVRLLTEREKMQAEALAQPQMGPDGQPIPPKPLPEIIVKLLKKPTWEQVEAVLRENGARCFRIDIETDSTIKADQDAEKASRIEFLTAAGGFIQQAAQIPVPELQPLLMEMLKFGVGGFKAGRELETEFKTTMDALKNKAENPQPQADPLAAEKERLAVDERVDMAKVQSTEKIEQLKIDSNERIERQRIESEEKRYRIESRAKASPEQIATDADLHEGGISPVERLAQQIAISSQQTTESLLAVAQGQQAIVAQLSKPKEVTVRRGLDGKMIGAVSS